MCLSVLDEVHDKKNARRLSLVNPHQELSHHQPELGLGGRALNDVFYPLWSRLRLGASEVDRSGLLRCHFFLTNEGWCDCIVGCKAAVLAAGHGGSN